MSAVSMSFFRNVAPLPEMFFKYSRCVPLPETICYWSCLFQKYYL